MIRPDDLYLFVRAASLGSFSAAARETQLLPGQVSAGIQRLERELGVRLFARSTRSLRLTVEGTSYLPHAYQVLDSLQRGRDSVAQHSEAIEGTLQIAAPSDLGRNVLLPWLLLFRKDHPKLNVRLLVSDFLADMYRDPVDVAIRYGRLQDSSLVSFPLAPHNRRLLAAAPAYLSRHGRPRSLDELRQHDCLRFNINGQVYDKWHFPMADGTAHVVSVTGPLVSDDADVVRRAAVAGEGILYKSWLDVCSDVQAGALEVLLPQQPGEAFPLHFVCPHREQFSGASRLLYAFIKDRLAALQQPVACDDGPEVEDVCRPADEVA